MIYTYLDRVHVFLSFYFRFKAHPLKIYFVSETLKVRFLAVGMKFLDEGRMLVLD